MLVVATEMSSRLNVRIKELQRVAIPGEEFEVSPSRYELLHGNNRYRAVFVVLAEKGNEVEVVENNETTEEQEKPVKPRKRKSTKKDASE